ncbi:MAG: sulfurtransferase [Candidatus Hydrogenedentes bacterium]|nr:sulfurtransferase [Candidatus Hydrogenedentota bacterium]
MRTILSLTLLLACAVRAESPLVDSASVATLTNALFVDARSAESFAAGHIPGAANLDVDSLSETRDGVIGMLKSHDALVPLFAAAGLEMGKTLVVYGGLEDGAEVKGVTRLFWVLEHSGFDDVRVLDGGLAKWKAEGGVPETGPSKVPPSSVDHLTDLKRAEALVVDKKQLMAAMDRGTALVVDLRSKDEYTGAKKKDFVQNAGHVPGAKSKPATSFVEGKYFTFKSPEKIREMIGSGVPAGKKPVITYCNSGRDATVGYLAYRIAGFQDVSVYDGSMAEWGNDATCPVAEGEE